MKDIQPIQIWKYGVIKTASVLNATIINDNLSSSCTFYWQLKEADSVVDLQTIAGEVLADGNATMSGQDYEDWNGDNELAYAYIAEQINVTIL